MHLLYVRASTCESDDSTILQLERLAPGTTVRPATDVDAASSILRNTSFEGRFDGVVTSPGLDDTSLGSLAHEIWRRGPAVSLIAVVLDLAHSLRAFEGGADAVLLLVNGTLSNARETLEGLGPRFRQPAVPVGAQPRSAADTTSARHRPAPVDLSTFRKYFAKPTPRGPITVAVVTEIDDELVDAVGRLVLQLSPSEPVPGRAELDAIIRADGSTMLVARDEAAIVGMLTLHTFRAATGIHAWIQDLVVDAHAKGRGVSERLTREAVRLGVAQGARTAELTSRPSHLGNARLYERIGFERRQTHLYRYRMSG
jgi:ribosomal protein S18 acetylase RimI-like enzyme